jgi:inosose dehydratase
MDAYCIPVPFQGKNLSRRAFLKSAGVAASASVLGAAAAGKALVGTQLYGWGQYYERDKKSLGEHTDEALSAIRDCGYDYAEGSLDVAHPENTVRFAQQLRAKGMRPVCIYTGARLHEAGKADDVVQKILEAAKPCRDAGFEVINCNADPIGREKTDSELATQLAAFKKLGQGLNQLGVRLGVHHHTPEMVNNAREFHHVFRNSEPGVVGFCFDVHWVYRGGLAPMRALEEYANRIVSWHLRQSRGGVWWEDLAEGDIDYMAIAQYAKAHGIPARYSVELALESGTKITQSVVENHRRSCQFVRNVFG